MRHVERTGVCAGGPTGVRRRGWGLIGWTLYSGVNYRPLMPTTPVFRVLYPLIVSPTCGAEEVVMGTEGWQFGTRWHRCVLRAPLGFGHLLCVGVCVGGGAGSATPKLCVRAEAEKRGSRDRTQIEVQC